jgi:twitching motility protein PilT
VPLVTSLLTAIGRADGDALVLHAGERPYVVAPAGHLELASRALTLEAVKGMLNELLPTEARQSLDDIGAVEYDLGVPAFGGGRVAAREVLLNTSAVADLIAEGKTSQLQIAIDSGRKHGMWR